jgi:hypothetical protein
MRRRHSPPARAVAAIFLLGTAACGGLVTRGEPLAAADVAPDATTIVARMNARYRGARTYSDEGRFRLRTGGEGRPRIETGTFRTRWVAPDRLYFELQQDGLEPIREETVFVWAPVRRAGEDEPSLADALAALDGVSHGAAAVSLGWLTAPASSLGSRLALRRVVSSADGRAFELVAPSAGGRDVTLVVDARTFAVRRGIFRSRSASDPPVETELTVDVEAAFDGPIDPRSFDLDRAS